MPPDRTTLITTHVHTDGPIPGPHSLLTVTAAAYTADGDPIGTFATNVRELAGATLHPVALQHWRARAEEWLTTRRGSRPPAPAMAAFCRWIDDLPGTAVLVTDPTQPDFVFVYWYLQRFAGRWPFSRTAPLEHPLPAPLCSLTGCRPLARAS